MRRRAPRRHGVRRRRRRRPLDRPGQGGRLLHGDQRRGRHRRHGTPTSAAGSARPSRSSRRGSSASTTVEFLGLPDGILEYGVPLRRAIAEVVRRHRPEIVITGNFRDTWGGRQPQPGRPHRRPAGRRSTPSATPATAGSSPSSSPTASSRGAACARSGRSAPRRPTHGVDTTDTFDAGVASLRGAPAYIDGLGWENFDPREFLEGMSRGRPASGSASRFAATFEVFPLGWGRLSRPFVS